MNNRCTDTTKVELDGTEFRIGQQWSEADNRFDRIVEVVGWDIRLHKIQIQCRGRRTWASAKRFGKSGGYILLVQA